MIVRPSAHPPVSPLLLPPAPPPTRSHQLKQTEKDPRKTPIELPLIFASFEAVRRAAERQTEVEQRPASGRKLTISPQLKLDKQHSFLFENIIQTIEIIKQDKLKRH